MRSITNVRITPAVTDADKRRQRIVLGGGSVVIAILSAILFWPEDQAPEPVVELVATPPAPVAAPAMPAPPVAAAPAQAPANLSQYILYGIGGGGAKGRAAIIGLPNGGQRVLPAGRTLTPGVTVKEVGSDHAILTTPSGDMRLEFRKTATAVAPPSVAAAGSPLASRTNTVPPEAARANAQHERNNVRFRLAMEPNKVGPNIFGYRVKAQTELPSLTAAGIRAGDILVSVNGEVIDSQERFHGLSESLASEPVAKLVYERGGRRFTTQVKPSDL